jgi:DedD protein
MAVQVAEEDFKRRARRRLMGAVALTILAVIILPLVLDKEPPPAGPLNIQMPLPPGKAAPGDQVPVAASPPAAKPEEDAGKLAASAAAPDLRTVPSTGEKAAQGAYSVQVGAFSDAANVNRIKSKIRTLGMPAFTDRLDGKTRVRAGPFPDKAAAEKAAAKLAGVGLPVKLEGP